MNAKMTGVSLFLDLLVFLSLMQTCHAQTKWTPDDFDWSALRSASLGQPGKGLYLNLTEYPFPARPEHAALIEFGTPDKIGETDIIAIPFTLGFFWQAFSGAVAIGGAVSAIQGCTSTDGQPWPVLGCVTGLAGTVISIGTAVTGAGPGKVGWLEKASRAFSEKGLLQMFLGFFSKRSQLEKQDLHEQVISDILRGAFGETEFLGYVSPSHRLAGRDDVHKHPKAPIHRFRHPKHGLMDIASREHVNSIRFTITYANHGLAERQSFQHEALNSTLMEARFDSEASQSDPGHPSWDPAGAFQQVEENIACFVGEKWEDGKVLSIQMYDTSAGATFGFASVGLMDDEWKEDNLLEDFKPHGTPFPACGS